VNAIIANNGRKRKVKAAIAAIGLKFMNIKTLTGIAHERYKIVTPIAK
jgi:hypothetical protein